MDATITMSIAEYKRITQPVDKLQKANAILQGQALTREYRHDKELLNISARHRAKELCLLKDLQGELTKSQQSEKSGLSKILGRFMPIRPQPTTGED